MSTEEICAIQLEEKVWVKCSAVSDLLMLNSDPNLNTLRFTGTVHSKPLGSLETHIYQSPDELFKAHYPRHVSYMG